MFGSVKAKPGRRDQDRQATVAEMLSVIIPASNEEALIGGCLAALAASEEPGLPVEVIVVANGCVDDTFAVAEAARSAIETRGWRFEVIDRAEGGKLEALNAGDLIATPGGMRAYLDADVTVSQGLLAEVAQALASDSPAYASGQVRIVGGPGFASRAYARLWAQVPFMKNSVPGCGFFAVNSAGRARWEEFPHVISDDIFVRLQFAPEERHQVSAGYDWPIADGFARLVTVRRRQDAGVAEISRLYPDLQAHEDKGRMGMAGAIRLALRDPVGFAVYVSVAIRVRMARQGADWSRSR
ncbi:glycosyltransferase family 2 protein [Flavimaricola marinus]|uniref:N-glycosyltransferase n=1 Tax=Flavimaricola marinus TaxID=1819565 RepID=A0A238LB38_9RHOB|nr:glycosyltransferase family 2 protein [Flavimaricola marinus]SMY06889.1 N-glycosyltransferase [Flavimaricola marinus]